MSSNRHRLKFAVYLIPRDGDKVLLSLRQNTGWKDGWYSLVAGHVEANEAAEQAMIREAREEAGIDVALVDLKHVYTMHRVADDATDEYVDVFFECHHWSGELRNTEPDKCGELRWVEVGDLPENTLDYIKHVLTKYPSGETYSSMEKT